MTDGAPEHVQHRERLGQIVRAAWIEWAREQENPKPSWLVEWPELAEPDKEVDRRIGERVEEFVTHALEAQLRQAVEERNEARNLLDTEREISKLNADRWNFWLNRAERMERERDTAQAAQQERDQATQALDAAATTTDHWQRQLKTATDTIAEVGQQRNQAQQRAQEAEAQCAVLVEALSPLANYVFGSGGWDAYYHQALNAQRVVRNLPAAVRTHLEQREAERTALAFYADKHHYWRGKVPTDIEHDYGARARAALAGEEA